MSQTLPFPVSRSHPVVDLAMAQPEVAPPLRVVIGQQDVLLREGMVRLMTEAGLEVVARTGDAKDLYGKALAYRPDVVVTDVRMPPQQRSDGLLAVIELRRRLPRTGVLIVSHYCEPALTLELLRDQPEGVGYLLKEHVSDVASFIEAIVRVGAGGSVLDPEVIARLVGRSRPEDSLHGLSPRQHAVLAAMAEGRSNLGIARKLHLSEASVEKHVTSLFRALAITPMPGAHRRVRAVLTYLQAMAGR